MSILNILRREIVIKKVVKTNPTNITLHLLNCQMIKKHSGTFHEKMKT
jgi:hypothetical protein